MKDFIIQSGGQGVNISSEMIKQCQVSHSKFKVYKEKQDKKEKDLLKKRELDQLNVSKQKALEEIAENFC